MPTALVIAHDDDGHGGQVTKRLAERGFDVTTHVVLPDKFQIDEAATFPDFAEFDLVAVMGSPVSLTRKHEIGSWIHDEIELIRSAHEAGQPVLGICFGGQLLAEALGATVESAGDDYEVGWFDFDVDVDGVNGDEPPIPAGPWFEWHQDRFSTPEGAAVIATTPRATQLYTIGRSIGTQFHPEVERQQLVDFLALIDDDYRARYRIVDDELLAPFADDATGIVDRCNAFVDWALDHLELS